MARRQARDEGRAAPDRRRDPSSRASIDLIAADAALAGDYAELTAVAKVVRFQRDFGRIARNFVNFADFYAKKDGVFQAGTLYLDGRALHLCIPVSDTGKHGALAGASDACLVYCDIKRHGTKKQIVAALTNGDAENVFVGRNGIFYDRDNHDWDATVAKIITNPICVREAFWAPYKKPGQVHRGQRHQARADRGGRIEREGRVGRCQDHAGLRGRRRRRSDRPRQPPDHVKKIDLGTIAAIGVAIGGIGTLVGALLGTLFGLGKWLPIGIVAVLLMISGPSMLLAWLKLRRRNLGPILDANGWAINGRARINVSFGAAMTELAEIPPAAQRALDDPFADKHAAVEALHHGPILVVLAGTWYVGRLDSYLPNRIRSVTVLGESAPAYKKPTSAPTPSSK